MTKLNFEIKNEKIRNAFLKLKKNNPERLKNRLKLSWSNWGFGIESLKDSAARLQRAGIKYIELHGNHYGPDLGYKPDETLKVLGDYGIKVGGSCGMFSADNDLSSNRPVQRQAAVDYIKRELEFAAKVGAIYMLVVPGAVGRPGAYDSTEFERSVETLALVADLFVKYNVKAAIEPIRAAEVSFIHTIADAKKYIAAVNHPGVQHINGDVYHMQVGESHIGEAIVDAGEMLVNLHMADSNRCALGDGSLDLDTIIMALYLIDYNNGDRFFTPEPLGPGGDPYPAMNGKPDRTLLEKLVMQTAGYFREREDVLMG
ncbi:MAG: sugar phosphate isomerase/epimerase [Ruminiclostridium sp.]|nr:sugar phosphate isomerase/epimerase [Ruminiclostridium sp.]